MIFESARGMPQLYRVNNYIVNGWSNSGEAKLAKSYADNSYTYKCRQRKVNNITNIFHICNIYIYIIPYLYKAFLLILYGLLLIKKISSISNFKSIHCNNETLILLHFNVNINGHFRVESAKVTFLEHSNLYAESGLPQSVSEAFEDIVGNSNGVGQIYCQFKNHYLTKSGEGGTRRNWATA